MIATGLNRVGEIQNAGGVRGYYLIYGAQGRPYKKVPFGQRLRQSEGVSRGIHRTI